MKVFSQTDITQHIKANPSITAKQLAQDFGYSQFHFSREFKKIMGVSLREFLSANKLEHGTKTLIAENNVTNAQIDAGYENIGAFSHNFKRFAGYSPKQHMHLIKNWATYIHALAKQDFAQPILYKLYDATSHHQCSSLTVKINNRQANSLVFIGLFSQSIPKQAPIFGVCLRKENQYCITNIPDGLYYVMTIEVLLHQTPSYYLSTHNFHRDICYTPITFPLQKKTNLQLTLREENIDDPPVILHPLKLLFDILTPPKA